MEKINNKRILKNILLLYLRLFFVMLVSLYTSRVILQALGVVDFGIYNVVGGVVALMSILNGAMSSSIQRYYSYEIGRDDSESLRKTFCISVNIYLFLCAIFFILAETIGIWFLNNRLTIPIERLNAANWVFHYSVLAMILSMLSNPLNAIIVAHEQMSIYAYVGILEVLLKLAIVFLLPLFFFDRLTMYAFLILIIQFIVTLTYFFFCKRKYPECRYKLYRDLSKHREILIYCGWNLFGSIASVVKTQGLNILLNIFFNPAINAARAIATQINSAIMQLSQNFYSAVRPQITKQYAQKNYNEMFNLMYWSSKISFFLILLISLPIIIEVKYIIKLWLGIMPDFSIEFVRIIVCISAIDAMANPLMTAAHATGKIALYQTLIGLTLLMNIPISYLFLKFHYPPTIVFYISLAISILCLFQRMFIVKSLISEFSIILYIKKVLLRVFLVTLSSISLVFLISLFTTIETTSFFDFIIILSYIMISVLVSIALFGLSTTERILVFNIVNKYLRGKIHG